MAGIVKGRVEVYHNGQADVVPMECPVEDPHRVNQPRCFGSYPDGEVRSCPYWVATTTPSNYGERMHPSTLRTRAIGLGARQISCQIICLRSRANRPPGC